jgi:hypothetical protein
MVGNHRAAKFNRANVKAESPIVRKIEGPVVGLLFSSLSPIPRFCKNNGHPHSAFGPLHILEG